MQILTLTNNLTQPLDQVRIVLLRFAMKSHWLREIYCDRALRLGFSFLILTTVYLAISLKWSIVLLVLGPLLLGYPHLIASYRFLQKPALRLGSKLSMRQAFRIFLYLTGISLCIRFMAPNINYVPEVPYGFWEIVLSLVGLGLMRIKLNSFRRMLVAILTLGLLASVLHWAWYHPMAFVGFALILHNWVAFGHWLLAAKDFKNRMVAITSLLIFALIHFLIFSGAFDTWIEFPKISFLSTKSFEASGWALASWSKDPLVWSRMIVIYTFGLSLHYFVWLSAIPQNLDQKEVPNSFRRTLDQLRQDCGPRTTILLFAIVMIAAFIFIFTPWAGPIYFGLAMLHGWLEFTFLIFAAFSALLVRQHLGN